MTAKLFCSHMFSNPFLSPNSPCMQSSKAYGHFELQGVLNRALKPDVQLSCLLPVLLQTQQRCTWLCYFVFPDRGVASLFGLLHRDCCGGCSVNGRKVSVRGSLACPVWPHWSRLHSTAYPLELVASNKQSTWLGIQLASDHCPDCKKPRDLTSRVKDRETNK